MSQAGFRSGWDGFPRHTSADENLVSSNVVYHKSKNGMSALGLQRVLGLGSYRTAWLMLHKLRQAMVRPGREKLCGEVEVDETYWGGAEFGGATGRKTLSEVLIIVAAEADGKRIGRIRMTLIEGFDRKTLNRFIQDNIELGSTFCTDGLNSYRELNGHIHIRKVQNLRQGGEPSSANSPGHLVAETVPARKPPSSASDKYLDDYLNEFVFRFDRRRSASRGKLFYRLAQQAVNA
jgi:ISXO2-like transposase domain